MRLPIAIVFFSLILLIGWFIQYPQSIPAEFSLLLRNSPAEKSSPPIDTDLLRADHPDNTLEEIPFMYQNLPGNETLNLQNLNPAKPVSKKILSARQPKAPINLSLPSTAHPTTPGLKLPESQKLILENQSKTPGISIGGGIEWDEKANKAKGAKISITIPTG